MVDARSILGSLVWRCAGPHRGGRVVAVAADPVRPEVFYFGSTGGGVWKTTDAGTTWRNVSDGFFKRASVGALAVAPSDPNVVYAGMGECSIRNTVSHGDGVYRSTDGGRTWRHLGLADTQNIARVRVHPADPDVAYVAALGHVYGPNPERGVYRTRDGGRTWERVLFRSDRAGAIDLSIDPLNPRVLYASIWEARRTPWSLESGGPGSGLFKSVDGGDTWVEITGNPGLPKGLKGKIGVAASPAKAGRVWMLVEAEDGGLFLSDDAGETWKRVNEDRAIRSRPWYYMHVIPDPRDPETVYALNVQMWRSHDGGRSFETMPVPHGDLHDLWIDPARPGRMILGGDGGACVTWNGGLTWSTLLNQPTAELYHVVCDNAFPYRIYGAQQDNTTVAVASRSDKGPINQSEWWEVGSGESGYVAVRPDDPNVVFTGNYQGYLARYDQRTRQARNVTVWPEASLGAGARDVRYRFQWTFPIVISPHDPNVLYATGNHVFRSRDEGASWEVASPDLTRADPDKLGPSGGLTGDNTGAEYYCTIFAFAESPVERGVLWAGSDDGLVHVSRDDGATWQNVTPPDLPEWALVSIIEASPHEPGAAYVAATRYKSDDFRPYLFKTTDYGRTWTKIVTGIEDGHFTRSIREDPVRRGLLYAGTEAGLYVSFDDGGLWRRVGGNLPVVPVHDLVVHDDDLVVATHGRSFWILDDVTLLRQLAQDEAEGGFGPASDARLYAPRTTVRWRSGIPAWMAIQADEYSETTKYTSGNGKVVPYWLRRAEDGALRPVFADAGENPPEGVIVHYWLREDRRPEDVSLAILDAGGAVIREFRGRPAEDAAPREEGGDRKAKPAGRRGGRNEPTVAVSAGYHRFIWDMRHAGPAPLEGSPYGSEAPGPLVPPGVYRVRLRVGDREYEQSFELVKDPRVPATQEDLERQFHLLLRIRDRLSETNRTIGAIRDLKRQLDEWERRARGTGAEDALKAAAKAARQRLVAIEEELIQTKAETRQDNLSHPARLNVKLSMLMGVVGSADAPPTRQSEEVFQVLSERLDGLLARFREALSAEVTAFNEAVREAALDPVAPAADAAK